MAHKRHNMARRRDSRDDALLARVRLRRRLQARRQSLMVPWKRFAATLADYVEWFLFCLWARTTLEADGHVSPELERALRERTPGFLEETRAHRFRGPRASVRFWLSLLSWVHCHHFSIAQEEGWMDGLRWYSASDSLVQKAWNFWHLQNDRRKAGRPVEALSFDQWRRVVESCSEFAEPGSPREEVLRLVASVDSQRLRRAVNDYVELCAFVFWVRAIESAAESIPTFVQDAIRMRWPDCGVPPQVSDEVEFWRLLLEWAERKFFPDVISEGWLAALQFFSQEHPRYQRILAYSLECEGRWIEHPMTHLPDFSQWIAAAEDYIESPEAE